MKEHFYTPEEGKKIIITPNPKQDSNVYYQRWLKHMKQVERTAKIKILFGDEFDK